MTEQNITALIWMIPIALVIQGWGIYAVLQLALTGKRLFTKREPEAEPMRGIHDFGGRR